MRYLSLQIHITGCCNLRCKHCYIPEHSVQMSTALFRKVIEQAFAWKRAVHNACREKVYLQLQITGGEPLLHTDLSGILHTLFKYRNRCRIVLMTNGTMLTPKLIRRLKRTRIHTVQLSLDGTQQAHDDLRGKGNYESVLRAMELLHQEKMPCRISFTAHRQNYTMLSKVAEICREHHAASLWSDRYIPIKSSQLLQPLTTEDMREYSRLLRTEAQAPENKACGLRIDHNRALQFLWSEDLPYKCRAGIDFLTVTETAEVYPCRRLPISCGNATEASLTEIYFFSSVLKELRKEELFEKCAHCSYGKTCLGGAKCFTYAVHRSYTHADPCCFWQEEAKTEG